MLCLQVAQNWWATFWEDRQCTGGYSVDLQGMLGNNLTQRDEAEHLKATFGMKKSRLNPEDATDNVNVNG